jgi:hypothetical protein
MEQFNPLSRERRAAPRSASFIRAYLLAPVGGLLPGVTRNLSRSGVFLQTKIPADSSVGDLVTIVFAVENGNIVRLLRYAVVIRRESHRGYGLEFGRCLWSTGIFRRS